MKTWSAGPVKGRAGPVSPALARVGRSFYRVTKSVNTLLPAASWLWRSFQRRVEPAEASKPDVKPRLIKLYQVRGGEILVEKQPGIEAPSPGMKNVPSIIRAEPIDISKLSSSKTLYWSAR